MRNMSRYTLEGWTLIIAGILLIFMLIAAVIQTYIEFEPSAEAIMAEQKQMQMQIDSLKADLTRISEAVEDWQGVKE